MQSTLRFYVKNCFIHLQPTIFSFLFLSKVSSKIFKTTTSQLPSSASPKMSICGPRQIIREKYFDNRQSDHLYRSVERKSCSLPCPPPPPRRPPSSLAFIIQCLWSGNQGLLLYMNEISIIWSLYKTVHLDLASSIGRKWLSWNANQSCLGLVGPPVKTLQLLWRGRGWQSKRIWRQPSDPTKSGKKISKSPDLGTRPIPKCQTLTCWLEFPHVMCMTPTRD